jgi:hypothetical protein
MIPTPTQRDAVGVVDQPIADGIGDGGVGDQLVPVIGCELAGEHKEGCSSDIRFTNLDSFDTWLTCLEKARNNLSEVVSASVGIGIVPHELCTPAFLQLGFPADPTLASAIAHIFIPAVLTHFDAAANTCIDNRQTLYVILVPGGGAMKTGTVNT